MSAAAIRVLCGEQDVKSVDEVIMPAPSYDPRPGWVDKGAVLAEPDEFDHTQPFLIRVGRTWDSELDTHVVFLWQGSESGEVSGRLVLTTGMSGQFSRTESEHMTVAAQLHAIDSHPLKEMQ